MSSSTKGKQDSVPKASEGSMKDKPQYEASWYKGSEKLKGKVAILTGADSGIGRAVAILFAREGAKVMIAYHSQTEDAEETKALCEKEGSTAHILKGDLREKSFCEKLVNETLRKFDTKTIDIVVNNAAMQKVQEDIEDITEEQLDTTFKTNIYSMFYLTQLAAPHMKEGSSIINTTSVTSFKGNKVLVDYSATKGAITTFTRSLAQQFAPRGIRVNGVAPGPIWTPLIVASFSKEKQEKFGKDTAMGRPGQPEELAPAYVYLACKDSSYVTGQIIHINGGAYSA